MARKISNLDLMEAIESISDRVDKIERKIFDCDIEHVEDPTPTPDYSNMKVFDDELWNKIPEPLLNDYEQAPRLVFMVRSQIVSVTSMDYDEHNNNFYVDLE